MKGRVKQFEFQSPRLKGAPRFSEKYLALLAEDGVLAVSHWTAKRGDGSWPGEGPGSRTVLGRAGTPMPWVDAVPWVGIQRILITGPEEQAQGFDRFAR